MYLSGSSRSFNATYRRPEGLLHPLVIAVTEQEGNTALANERLTRYADPSLSNLSVIHPGIVIEYHLSADLIAIEDASQLLQHRLMHGIVRWRRV